jgi:transcriptional regulator with XRE-family HTH domain
MDAKTEIGEKARQTRKAKSLGSMREIGKLLEISRNDISEIERGIFNGSLNNVLKYLNYLGLTLKVQTQVKPTLDELAGMFSDD